MRGVVLATLALLAATLVVVLAGRTSWPLGAKAAVFALAWLLALAAVALILAAQGPMAWQRW